MKMTPTMLPKEAVNRRTPQTKNNKEGDIVDKDEVTIITTMLKTT
jgi:hypothetical protein